MADQPPILEMKNITKTFPGVKALSDVSFQVAAGEIHCLVGENGAGKSTLMKVLSGVYPHGTYTGDILFSGQVQKFSGISDSEKVGIAIIYQELALVPEMTVYENIFLGNEIRKGFTVDWNETIKRATDALKRVRLDVNPEMKVKNLGVGKQQLIEIAKALSKDVKLLILDEPTAALNEDDSENLLKLIRELKEHGVSCVMISHKLREVIAIADTVTVLRDGHTICTLDAHKGEVSEHVLIKHMVGREINNIYPERQRNPFKAAAAAVEEAQAAGVKVISYDRLITNTQAVDYYVTFDSVAVGAQQAGYLVDHATGKGNPLYLYAGAATDNNAFLFFQGAWGVLQPRIADGTFVIKNSSQAVSLQANAALARDQEKAIFGQISTNWDRHTAWNLAQFNLASATTADKGNVFILAPNDNTARRDCRRVCCRPGCQELSGYRPGRRGSFRPVHPGREAVHDRLQGCPHPGTDHSRRHSSPAQGPGSRSQRRLQQRYEGCPGAAIPGCLNRQGECQGRSDRLRLLQGQ